jgi:hypothetical protein
LNITNNYIYQPTETSLANSGRAAYNFTINNAGTYPQFVSTGKKHTFFGVVQLATH